MNDYIKVCANNSTDDAKTHSDYVCTGVNDELTIGKAILDCIAQDKNLYLANGIYRIDGFHDFSDGGPRAAICFPRAHREIAVVGQNNEYGFQKRYDNGVVFYVSDEAMSTLGEDGGDVIRGEWSPKGIQNGSNLNITNLAIILANNTHAIRCMDLRRVDRVELKNVTMLSYGDLIKEDSNMGLHETPPVANKDCIGLTMTDGSNYNYSNYTNVFVYGFGEGIQVGGEHVVCINCGATLCLYGFTFGNYESNCGLNHPITLINCLDERNVHLPYFGKWCGDGDGKGGRLIGRQEVTFISFNIERLASKTPGGVLGDLMREEIPGSWCGKIDFTAQPEWCALNDVAFEIWERDGSGSGIRTRNACHKDVATTAERNSYYPMLAQQIFDTDLGKLVICIDPANKIWVDTLGNKV